MSQRIISQISQLFAAGRFAEAEKLCLSAAQTSPGDGMIPAFRGAIKLELGDIKSAVVFLSKAISVDPGNATAHFNLGVAQKSLCNWKQRSLRFERPWVLPAQHRSS